MAKKHGLPTFPVSSGMRLRKRAYDELEWLLEHGFIQSDIYCYQKIAKSEDGLYHLVENDEHDPALDREIASSTALRTLLQEHALDLASWSWYGHDFEHDM